MNRGLDEATPHVSYSPGLLPAAILDGYHQEDSAQVPLSTERQSREGKRQDLILGVGSFCGSRPYISHLSLGDSVPFLKKSVDYKVRNVCQLHKTDRSPGLFLLSPFMFKSFFFPIICNIFLFLETSEATEKSKEYSLSL